VKRAERISCEASSRRKTEVGYLWTGFHFRGVFGISYPPSY